MKSPRLALLFLLPVLLPGLMCAQSVEPQNTVIDCEQFDWRSTDKETTSVFTGKVVVTGTNLRLTCERLEIVATRKGDPAATIGKIDSFKSFIATGNVHIVQGDREAACGKAEILPRNLPSASTTGRNAKCRLKISSWALASVSSSRSIRSSPR